MNDKVNGIINRMKSLEIELEQELDLTGDKLRYRLQNHSVHFEQETLQLQRKFKVNLFRYALFPKPRHVLVAPFIYALLPVLIVLDLLASLYHAIGFPLLGIPRIKRSDYLIFDRQHLAYLNLLEKMNCAYCSYGNGLLAYLSEMIARTEQYWCPIKHARRMLGTHKRYQQFLEYGDAEAYRRDLDKLRQIKD